MESGRGGGGGLVRHLNGQLARGGQDDTRGPRTRQPPLPRRRPHNSVQRGNHEPVPRASRGAHNSTRHALHREGVARNNERVAGRVPTPASGPPPLPQSPSLPPLLSPPLPQPPYLLPLQFQPPLPAPTPTPPPPWAHKPSHSNARTPVSFPCRFLRVQRRLGPEGSAAVWTPAPGTVL